MTEKELDRNAARRLAIIKHAEEVTGNVALTCRYYGISRQVFYRWYRRYQEEGLAGLRDRSKRPLHCPHETPAEVVAKIIYLRTNYHSARRRSHVPQALPRHRHQQLRGVADPAAGRPVPLPAYQRYKRADRKWKRYEKPRPGHAVQVDVKFIAPLSTSSRKKYYQFTAIDDCTRIRVLRIYDQLNQKTAIQFADYLLDKLPFRVEAIQTDNGSEFQSAFHWHLMDRGIRHIYIKPATPRLNGKVERSHRIDAEEFYRQLKGVLIDDAQLFNDRLQEWQDFYNYHRPHGSLGGQTPYERLLQKTTEPAPEVNDLPQLHMVPAHPYGRQDACRQPDHRDRRLRRRVRPVPIHRSDGGHGPRYHRRSPRSARRPENPPSTASSPWEQSSPRPRRHRSPPSPASPK